MAQPFPQDVGWALQPHGDFAELSGRMDRLESRMERIETRLNLKDA